MSDGFAALLAGMENPPVLLDVGASGKPPADWEPIARHAVYVGFDPDLREMRDIPNGHFKRAVVVNEAVTSEAGKADVHFYLTRSPFCSGTLPPDQQALQDYLFADLFTVERETDVRATTLNAVLDRLHLPGIDWLKVDTQGTDLRIFTGLREEVRARVLALDVEPGLTDAYLGEDLFIDTHRRLLQEGFWPSRLEVKGAVRMRNATLDALAHAGKPLPRERIDLAVRTAPVWVEARYLRSLDWLARIGASRRDYTLLWVFALLDAQTGFALDLAVEYQRRFGDDETTRFLIEGAAARLRPPWRKRLTAGAKAALPSGLKQLLKKSLSKS